jgi:hypothetical protein
MRDYRRDAREAACVTATMPEEVESLPGLSLNLISFWTA